MNKMIRDFLVPVLGVLLAVFTLIEVNQFSLYPNQPHLQPLSQLATFGLLGIVLCFLVYPAAERWKDVVWLRSVDLVLVALTVFTFGYVIVQSEPMFKSLWSGGQSLGNRAGIETPLDFAVGAIGLLLVLEATRRSIGWALPLLAIAFIGHAYFGEELPNWLLPHAQMKWDQLVSVTFLQSLGVFGPASSVMFKYVYLFVIFGAFLEVTGATQFIVDFAERVFGHSPGGPAKVAVLGSGLMGSLSGSAVANAVTTGAFTIPMMRNAGFAPHIAGGITAAAASGGALVPPVMGAGAYMMLELIEPPVTFLQVAKAALIPAVLYYFSIFMIVHFTAGKLGVTQTASDAEPKPILSLLMQFEGVVFFGALFALIGFLIVGFSPFRAVTYSLGIILLLGLVHPRQRLTPRMALNALTKSARNGISLVSASACVGIIIGIVQSTGVAGEFNVAVRGLVEQSLFLALLGIMLCSLILGMGVPSVVCYLLMATLMGSLLKELGVIPLAAHLFIFYFGMMSMVTPPVALAAFASASIANANIMKTGIAAFLFSLVGFTLPFMFIYRPELLLLSNKPELQQLKIVDRDGADPQLVGYVRKNGEPVENAILELQSSDGGEPSILAGSSTGRFQVPMAAAGSWRVTYWNPPESEDSDSAAVVTTGTIPEGATRESLGDFVYRPDAPALEEGETMPEGSASLDPRIEFVDRRLSILQVILGSLAAVVGIVSLAAGIAGYFRSRLNPVFRLLAFVAAALLLYPGRGFLLGDVRVGITDLAGLAVLVVVAVMNRSSYSEASSVGAGSEGSSPAADPAALADDISTNPD